MKTLLEIFDHELINEPNILNMPSKQRFKDKTFNAIYWRHINMTPDQVQEYITNVGGNWMQAFRDGYKGYRCKYQRNWTLYPIYVAGKEWRKVNKINYDPQN